MITLPELLVVLVAFSLAGGYIAIINHILTHTDDAGKAAAKEMPHHK